MKPGDKVTVEGEVVQVGEGWLMIRFPRVAPHPVVNARVPAANVKAKRGQG